MTQDKIVTDALGFRLEVTFCIGDFKSLGQHVTFQDESGIVTEEAPHTINLKSGLARDVINTVVPHEVYHLFYSVRHLIKADEETEAEVFGELVGRILNAYAP
jgi:hypothetical protein